MCVNGGERRGDFRILGEEEEEEDSLSVVTSLTALFCVFDLNM